VDRRRLSNPFNFLTSPLKKSIKTGSPMKREGSMEEIDETVLLVDCDLGVFLWDHRNEEMQNDEKFVAFEEIPFFSNLKVQKVAFTADTFATIDGGLE
jgi:hypothetical protein